jgi:TonB family protein
MFKPKHFANPTLIALVLVAFSSVASAQNNLTAKASSIHPQPVTTTESDRIRDGLAGPVRRVRTEVAKLSSANGHPNEDKRVVLETASYDIKGSKTENQYFPVAGSALTGKEVYKYDERGNISEMTLLNADGTLLGREVYKYDYDAVGNWTRMTTSVAVVEAGKVTFEPTEVTYRSIVYYLDENVLKMARPNTSVAPASATSVKVEPKSQPVAEVKSQPSNTTSRQAVAVNHKAAAVLPTLNTGNKTNTSAPGSVLSNSRMVQADEGTVVVLDAPPPPVSSVPRPLLKPISGGVLNGKALSLPAPPYPEMAKRLRVMGIVTIEVVLDETGKVISAQASSGPPLLREVAIQAAMRAKFSPTALSGQPVKVTGVINYKFSLSQ